MTTLAAIYSRISHDPEDRQAGVERQEQDCRGLAEQRGWTVLSVYRENDTSASTASKKARPIFDQMLRDAEAGTFTVLLTYSTSRLTRRPMEYERLIAVTAATGLQIQTVVSGPVQLDTADGRAIARVLAVIDAAEAERTSERVTRAKLQRAQNGLWHGGRCPFGYHYEPDPSGRGVHLVITPSEARMVREASRRVIAGDSLRAISRDWNKRQLPTPLGASWRSQGIRKMLVQPAAAGMTMSNGQEYPGVWPAILSHAQWDAARLVLLDARRTTQSFRQVAKRYPMGGLLVCGRCDWMLVSNPLRGVPAYICSSANGGCGKIRIQSDHLERFLLARISERDAAGLEPPAQAQVREALRQLQDDHYDGVLDRADYLRQSQRLRAALGARRDLVSSPAPLDDSDKRAVFRRALDRVVVLPHPQGQPVSNIDWPRREALLQQRLRLQWH
jgi:site-specific DNA recombinase